MSRIIGSTRVRIVIVAVVLIPAFFGNASVTDAQERALSVTVTPPLIQLTIGPGEVWASAVKIVNNNPYPVTYYSSLSDFEAQGEEGQSKFVPLINQNQDEATNTFSLARWITLDGGSVTIPAGQSADLPFVVKVPANAEPGGHYAAILVGTQPPPRSEDGPLVRVSTYVSSLLMVRVKGETVESARIREFRTEKEIYDKPEVNFVLRFENTGNTHLRPQGDISIYNMWGKERGVVRINDDKNNFGNVLPQSIRKFEFNWAQDGSILDIGRYSAVVTLTYGEGGKQNINATNYFWVVPMVPVAITLATILLIILMATWLVRRYIRRALALETERIAVRAPVATSAPREPRVISALAEPIREGVIDLRKMRAQTAAMQSPAPLAIQRGDDMTFGRFVRKYKLFFVFLVFVIVSARIGFWYFKTVLKPQGSYEITNMKTNAESAEPKTQ